MEPETIEITESIPTPEGVTEEWWLNMEATHTQGGVKIETPDPAPHPNEVATRQAVQEQVYTADEVGL